MNALKKQYIPQLLQFILKKHTPRSYEFYEIPYFYQIFCIRRNLNGDEEKKPDTGKTSAELLAHMLVKAKQGLHYNVSVLDWEEYHTVQKCETENEYDIWFFPLRDKHKRDTVPQTSSLTSASG